MRERGAAKATRSFWPLVVAAHDVRKHFYGSAHPALHDLLCKLQLKVYDLLQPPFLCLYVHLAFHRGGGSTLAGIKVIHKGGLVLHLLHQ